MANFKAARLQGRAVIEIAGAEAADFLQGLVTSDVESLKAGSARNAALLTPQGKILFEFMILAKGDGHFLLDCPRETAAELAKRLTFYRLRAKITIAERPDDAVIAIWGDGETAPVANAFADPRLADLGWRAILPGSEVEAVLAKSGPVDEAAYHGKRSLRFNLEPGQVGRLSTLAFPVYKTQEYRPVIWARCLTTRSPWT